MARGVKTGGRKKGTPNKVTKDLRAVIKALLEKEFEDVGAYLEAVEPKERLNFMIKLLPYALPRYETAQTEDGSTKENSSFSEYVQKQIEMFQ